MKKILFIFLLLFVHSNITSAQLVINEYSCSNISGPTDNFGNNEDWAELYNTTGSNIDLSGYFLSDKSGNLTKWQIPAGSNIPANGFAIVFFSGRDLVVGSSELHASFGLTQTKGEWIILSEPGGNVVDSLKIVKVTKPNHSYGRTTDGASTWSLFTTPTFNSSNTGGINYYTAKPQFDLAPGFYTGTQTLTLSTTDPSATIHYTTDGSTPTATSPIYSSPISITSTTVVRAIGVSSDPNTPDSFVETNTYFIDSPHTIPVVSVCGDLIQDFLNNTAPGSFNNNFDGAFELFENDGSFIDEGEGYYNKHGNDSWAYDQRGFDFVMKDQYGYNYAVKHKIFTIKDRDKFKRLILKPAANDNLSFEDGAHIRDAYVHTLSQLGDLRMDERTNRSCIVYVDGQYWGVYEIREKVDDDDFTEYYYNQPGDQIDFIKTWGSTWTEYGNMTHWTDLYNFILANNMADSANYAWVKERYNTGSLIDYAVLNSYVVTTDWLNWNTAWWHGHVPPPDGDKQKFRYTLWDMDATFGHYINYTGVPDTSPNADPCNVEALNGSSDPQGHMTILTKLMDNDEFKQQYISRYIDLSNTIFQCSSMINILDSMIAVIEPEMPGQVARWGGTMTQWYDNVQELKDFINARCAALSTGLIDCYNLDGPYDVVVNVMPAGAGEVKVNSVWAPTYPWSSVQYGGINTLFKASANSGYSFDHWEAQNHTFNNANNINDTLVFSSSDTITAYFVQDQTTPVDSTEIPEDGFTGVHIPNAFSPNNDGQNDFLQQFIGYDILNFKLIIIDRWGQIMFETTSPDTFWDGTYKGKLVNTGVYTYVVEYQTNQGQILKKSGNITVVR
jgi:gliding motility-associated-like protein